MPPQSFQSSLRSRSSLTGSPFYRMLFVMLAASGLLVLQYATFEGEKSRQMQGLLMKGTPTNEEEEDNKVSSLPHTLTSTALLQLSKQIEDLKELLNFKEQEEALKAKHQALKAEQHKFKSIQEEKIDLPSMVRAYENTTCSRIGTFPVQQVVNAVADKAQGRKIPQIVHQTGRDKCMTQVFLKNTQDWSFQNYSYYYHDNEAMDILLNKFWKEFPQLHVSVECLKNAGGAAMTDLWRYLLLWEYGGIYVDLDCGVGPNFTTAAITPETDAYFVQEAWGFLSQYFIATSPKHPLMFLAIYDVLEGMLALNDVGDFSVPWVTGPHALKRAFVRFMDAAPMTDTFQWSWSEKNNKNGQLKQPCKGTYYGWHNRSVTVDGDRKKSQDLVIRDMIRGKDKADAWAKMGNVEYKSMNKVKVNKTCLQLVLEKQQEQALQDSSPKQKLQQEMQRRFRF